MDVEGIQSGALIENVYVEALDSSKCLLFFHSENSNNSQWAIRELEYAFRKDKTIVPIKLDDSDYSPFLQFMDNLIY